LRISRAASREENQSDSGPHVPKGDLISSRIIMIMIIMTWSYYYHKVGLVWYGQARVEGIDGSCPVTKFHFHK